MYGITYSPLPNWDNVIKLLKQAKEIRELTQLKKHENEAAQYLYEQRIYDAAIMSGALDNLLDYHPGFDDEETLKLAVVRLYETIKKRVE